MSECRQSTDYLLRILDDADENVRTAFRQFGTDVDVLGTIIFALDRLGRLASGETKVLLFICQALSYLIGAVRLAAGGQLAQTSTCLRGALESAAYALCVYDDKKAWDIWRDREKNQESRKRARDLFILSVWKKALSRKDATLAKRVGELYDKLIDIGAHPNVGGVTRNMFVDTSSDYRRVGITVFCTDRKGIQETLRRIGYTGKKCIEIFKLILPAEVASLEL